MNAPVAIQRLFWGNGPALLLVAGQWLAATLTTQDTVLRYSLVRSQVGALTTIHLTLRNNGRTAIDDLTIDVQSQDLAKSAFAPPVNKQVSSPHMWEGNLTNDASLQVLLIYTGSAPSNDDLLAKAIDARYQARDEEKGTLDWKSVELVEGGKIDIPRGVEYVFWFLSPTGAVGIVLLVLLFVAKRRGRNQETSSRPKEPSVTDTPG